MEKDHKIIIISIMERIYVRDLKDDSKIGFAKSQTDDNVLVNDDAFEKILNAFEKDCLNHNLSDESKTGISIINTIRKGESTDTDEFRDEVCKLFKDIIKDLNTDLEIISNEKA